METLKESIKRIVTDKKLYIFTIFTLLFFGIYCVMQYAPDTYSVFTNTPRQNLDHFFSCGRLVTGLFLYGTMGILELNATTVYMISYGLAIICTIASLYKIDKIFAEDIKDTKLSILVSLLIIINVFSIELFVYVEKGFLMLSVLLCVLAVEQIKKFLEGKKIAFFWALIFMLIANCCYQGTVGLVVAIGMLYIIKYSKNVKEFIKNNILVALVYGIPAILNFIMVRFLFTNSRVKGEIILAESLKKIYEGTKSMIFANYDLLPKYLFAIILLGLVIFLIYQIIKKAESTKAKILEILGIFYIIIGTIFVTIAPQIMQDTNSIWFVARSSYPVASLIGILLIYATMRIEIKKMTKIGILIIATIFLGIQFVSFMRYSIDNYIVNGIDRQNVEQIQAKVLEYEEKTGKQITKIAFYEDKMPNYTYSNIKATGDMNLKALYKDWSALRVIKYYTGRNLEQIEKNEETQKEFKEKDWNYYNDEQLIFEDDVLHLCNF